VVGLIDIQEQTLTQSVSVKLAAQLIQAKRVY